MEKVHWIQVLPQTTPFNLLPKMEHWYEPPVTLAYEIIEYKITNIDQSLSQKSQQHETVEKKGTPLGRQHTWPSVPRARDAFDSTSLPLDIVHTQSHENDKAHLVVVCRIVITVSQ